MIVLKCLGGGFGNLCFQYFAALAASLKRAIATDTEPEEIIITNDYVDCNGRPSVNAYADLWVGAKCTPLTEVDLEGPVYQVVETGHRYIPLPIRANARGMLYLKGYFQSYKYLGDHAQIAREIFSKARPEQWAAAVASVQALGQGQGRRRPVCIHVRRGDYLNLADYHTVLAPAYYERAMAALELDPARDCVLLFSDDTETVRHWACFEAFAAAGALFVMDDPDPVFTLYQMMQCEAFVLANSSLSLAAFLLSRPAPATAPLQWFGPKGPAFNMDDIVPPETILLDGV